MLQGYSFGSTNIDAPEPSQMSGTFFWLRYLRIAVLGAVPIVWNMIATCSCSTSLRVCSIVLGGL